MTDEERETQAMLLGVRWDRRMQCFVNDDTPIGAGRYARTVEEVVKHREHWDRWGDGCENA